MSLLKYAALGAAVAYGISHITKKRASDGKSLLDDWSEKAPEFVEKAKKFSDEALEKVSQRTQEVKENYQ